MKRLIFTGIVALMLVLLALPGAVSAGDTLTASGKICPAAPDADFTVAATNGLAPVSASFADASTGTIDTWKWEYQLADDGDWTEFSTVQNPSAISFSTAGTYNIRLTVTNTECGLSDSETIAHAFAAATAHGYLTTIASGEVSGDLFVLSASPFGASQEEGVDKTSTQTYTLPASGSNIEKAYVFVNIYSGSGQDNKPVLTTTELDADGDDSFETTLGTETMDIASGTTSYVYPLNDHVDKVYSDYEAWYDVTDYLQDASSTIPQVKVTTTNVPGQTLFDGRIKGITLVVAYNDGDSDQVKYWVNHGNDRMSPAGASSSTAFDTSSLSSGWTSAVLKEVAFSSTDASYTFPTTSNSITATSLGSSSYWKYNSFDATSALSAGSSNTFGFTAVGSSFKICLATLTASYAAPEAAFTYTPTTIDKDTEVTFDASSSTGATSYAWIFGDGEIGSGVTATHTYTTAGDYTVKLTVTNSQGEDYMTQSIHVNEPKPVITFTPDSASGARPLAVDFAATNTGGSVTTWTWEYKLSSDTGWTAFGSNAGTASKTFDAAGIYDVRVTAAGPDYTVIETHTGSITVGASTIDVTVGSSAINLGEMSTTEPGEGSTDVTVVTSAGAGWSVSAAAGNSGKMMAGTTALLNGFQLSNDGGSSFSDLSALTDNTFTDFMYGTGSTTGTTQTANVKQVIDSTDAAGSYSIAVTFTGTVN